MQRDRLMTGVQSSGIDLTWLLANLQVASVRTGADADAAGEVETLVLGPKAVQTAESYVLSLFHLYPNVYLHKTTRGAEMMFEALMRRLLQLGREGHGAQTGLPSNHPILRFASEPGRLEHALGLDDLVFWGALPMLTDAADGAIARLASGLRDRSLLFCIDVRRYVEQEMPQRVDEERKSHQARITLTCSNIETSLKALPICAPGTSHRILIDRYSRPPYKRFQDSNTPLNRILIHTGAGEPRDMAELSPVIAGGTFRNLPCICLPR
jgi:uncharacterized protein